MEYVDAQENFKTGGVMGLWIEESERADQSSSAQQKTSLESTAGQRGEPGLAEVTKRDDSKPDARHFVVRVHTSGLSWTVAVLHTSMSCRTGLWPARSSWQMMTLLWRPRRAMRRSAGRTRLIHRLFRFFAPSLSGTLALALSLFRFFSSRFRP